MAEAYLDLGEAVLSAIADEKGIAADLDVLTDVEIRRVLTSCTDSVRSLLEGVVSLWHRDHEAARKLVGHATCLAQMVCKVERTWPWEDSAAVA